MEFMQKGAILSKNYFEQEKIDNNGHLGFNEAIQEYEGKKVLPLEKARKYFREFLLGLDYRKFKNMKNNQKNKALFFKILI